MWFRISISLSPALPFPLALSLPHPPHTLTLFFSDCSCHYLGGLFWGLREVRCGKRMAPVWVLLCSEGCGAATGSSPAPTKPQKQLHLFWPLTFLKDWNASVRWLASHVTQKRSASSQHFLQITSKVSSPPTVGRCYQVLPWIPQCWGMEHWIPGMQQDTQQERSATNIWEGFFVFGKWILSLLHGRCSTCSHPRRRFTETFIIESRQRISGPEMIQLSWSY